MAIKIEEERLSKMGAEEPSVEQISEISSQVQAEASRVSRAIPSLPPGVEPGNSRLIKTGTIADLPVQDIKTIASQSDVAKPRKPAGLMDIDHSPPKKSSLAGFPNVALEFLALGMRKERHLIDSKITPMRTQSRENVVSSRLLLNTSASLHGYSEEKSARLDEKTKQLLSKLKEKGIELFADPEKELSKEELSAAKSAISSHLNRLQTAREDMMTDFQTAVQVMNTLHEVLKQVNRLDDRLKSKTMGNNQHG